MNRSTAIWIAIGLALTVSSLLNQPMPPLRVLLTAVVFGVCVFATLRGLQRRAR